VKLSGRHAPRLEIFDTFTVSLLGAPAPLGSPADASANRAAAGSQDERALMPEQMKKPLIRLRTGALSWSPRPESAFCGHGDRQHAFRLAPELGARSGAFRCAAPADTFRDVVAPT
jgi:hypothetical protein